MLNQTQLRPHNHNDGKGYFQLAEKFAEVAKLTVSTLRNILKYFRVYELGLV